jgi:FtsH-binding integral membrane protein
MKLVSILIFFISTTLVIVLVQLFLFNHEWDNNLLQSSLLSGVVASVIVYLANFSKKKENSDQNKK